MMKLALAFLIVLYSGGALASARALASGRALSNDGISQSPRATRAVRRTAATRRAQKARRRKGEQRFGGGNYDLTKLAPARPRVTEIDADGLKKLLQRAEGQAARPLLVNFWATWCVPCRKEFPDLVKIEADYRGRGLLEFALVSADDVSDIKTAVPKFLRGMRATAMPAYLLNAADTQAAIAQVDPAWGGELPATFLFDRQGKLAYKHFGIIDAAKLRQEINKVTGGE